MLLDDMYLAIANAENPELPKSKILGYAPVPVNLNQHETLTPSVSEARSKDVVI
jgi:hypothetical protein